MFERFTEKAIKVIMLAQEEARKLGHNYVGTEFILLGLIGEGTGIAARTLTSKGVNLGAARVEVENTLGRGSGSFTVEVPFSISAKRLLEVSWQEARKLDQDYIGTEHLLLGLISEGRYYTTSSEQAVRILEGMGIDVEKLNGEIIQRIDKAPSGSESSEQRRIERPGDSCHGALGLALHAIIHAKEAARNKQDFQLAAWLREHEVEFENKINEVADRAEREKTSSKSRDLSLESILAKCHVKAVKVHTLAQDESRRLGHNFVGTEQILLALIGEGTSDAAKVLKTMGATLRDARAEVEKIIGRGSGFVAVQLPVTPRAKRVYEIALAEANSLGHEQIGPEHILLGILVEGAGVAARVLENLNIDNKQLKKQVMDQLSKGGAAKD